MCFDYILHVYIIYYMIMYYKKITTMLWMLPGTENIYHMSLDNEHPAQSTFELLMLG